MKPLSSSSGTVWQINIRLAYAVFLFLFGVVIYPSDPKWWAFYFLSVICCMSALGLAGQATKSAIEIRIADRQKKELLARGEQAHSARLATDEELEKAGIRK